MESEIYRAAKVKYKIIFVNHGENKIPAIKSIIEATKIVKGVTISLADAKKLSEGHGATMFIGLTEKQVAEVKNAFGRFDSDATLDIVRE